MRRGRWKTEARKKKYVTTKGFMLTEKERTRRSRQKGKWEQRG